MTGAMFLVSLSLVLVYLYMQLHALPEVTKSSLNPIVAVTHPGSLALETDANAQTFAANKEIAVIVSGNSKDVPVGGYDAVIMYDPMMLEFIDVKNEMENYDFFPTKKAGVVSLTASLKLTGTPIALTNAILATLRFKTKNEGKAAIHFQYEPNKTTDSNLLSNKAKDILGTVSNLDIVVGKQLTVSMNRSTEYNGKKISLLEAEIPQPSCRDCQSLVRIAIEENGKTEVIQYRNGGINGLVEREKSIGKTVYRLEDASQTTASLIVGER